ncbi:DUF885 domain-containing protein [Microbulbifer magnicolonia]|uniref:DUF885 domain-containing protein n=1 Tax=Microbulbifer magnicolonia TaxID=3109744 RepID=UPI002B414C1C|nr:DUF885 domain-containing protein [Microbulbifer sp. GG15]
MKSAPRRTLLAAAVLMLAVGNLWLPAVAIAPLQAAEAQTAAHDEALVAHTNRLFEEFFQQRLARSPEQQTFLGIKNDYAHWDDLSAPYQAESLALYQRQLQILKTIDPQRLDDATRLSLTLAMHSLETEIEGYRWRHHNYFLNTMYGTRSRVSTVLIVQHSIDTLSDADAYIARMHALPEYFDQIIQQLERRAELGIIAPRFAFAHAIRDSENMLHGAPFSPGSDSPLLADFRGKVDKLDLSAEQKSRLLNRAEDVLAFRVAPAYRKLIGYLHSRAPHAKENGGAWQFPDGDDYYGFALRRFTTTDLSASEIHEIGLQETARIHRAMRAVMTEIKFPGNMSEFFAFMRSDPQFYYPQTAEGRAQYISDATALIGEMEGRLDELFTRKPQAPLVVKAVEPFREASAGKAFYQRVTTDGSRPGIFYVNLHNMRSMPKYQMAALAYHEGIPGHHMQRALAQEMQGIPRFRRQGNYTAYTEGWGLYAESLAAEMGLYQDPYAEFGRLASELWRAARLVVDTGIHQKKWSRQRAEQWLSENTPNAPDDIAKSVERYIINPGQATAYKVGMRQIQMLRATAQATLGDQFDMRAFHDIVLTSGAVPLDLLEDQVNSWIKTRANDSTSDKGRYR